MERSKQNQALDIPHEATGQAPCSVRASVSPLVQQRYGIGDASGHLPPSFMFESSENHMG